MDLNAASLFVRVASALSFSAAARELGLPRSTVSKRILELEEELGVKLLHRTSRAVTLTEAGHRFLTHAHQAMSLLQHAGMYAAITAYSTAAPVRLATSRPIVQTFGAELARRVEARSPGLRLVLDLAEEAPELVSGGYDLAVVLQAGRPRGRPRNERTTTLAELPLVVVGSPAYLETRAAPERPGELVAHDVLALTGERGPITWTLSVDGRSQEVALAPRIAYADHLAVRALALQGYGLAQLPLQLVQADLDQGRLREVLAEHRPHPARVVLTRAMGEPRPALQVVLDVVAELASSRTLPGVGP